MASPTSTSQVPATCGLDPTAGTITRSVGARSYHLYVPPGLTARQAPLLISNHGGGNTAAIHEAVTGWTPYATEHHFIVAYPESPTTYWNFDQNSPDVAYLREVVADVESAWCVDPHRVFSDGFSSGAIMSQRMACDAPEVFAAATSWAGFDPTDPNVGSGPQPTPCTPSRPIAIGLFQGENDFSSTATVGQGNVEKWIARAGIDSTPQTSTDTYATLKKYEPGKSGASICWRTYKNVTHIWPGGDTGQDLRDHIWQFLDAHARP
ncbi:PHB depolymerase family esterase [Nocardia sp. NPDC051030]|uniref:alpha/beta hydrolase family esterase n=1 Tax=Nocardia sp. NPDC051030 TaxID=3155162 RepID=UPI003424A38B